MNTIIFVHKGHSYYLDLAIAQAKKYNPDCEILLFGDESNNNIPDATHYNINDYFGLATDFDNVFFNNSPNRRSYELFCFQRWFIIREFMIKHPEYDKDFIYCDSDTLLFSNAIEDLEQLSPRLIATESWESPAFTFFKKGTLTDFCDMIMWLYTTKEGLDTLIHYINRYDKESFKQGISDMTAFKHYTTILRFGQCIDAQVPVSSWSKKEQEASSLFCYDHNINIDNGFLTDLMGRKKVTFINNIPYCVYKKTESNVRFKGIHYQGDAKYMMISHQSACSMNICLLKEYIKGWAKFRIKMLVRWLFIKMGLSLRMI